MTIAEMAIAIGLSAPLNFMIPRFKSDMTVFSDNSSLIVALPSADGGQFSRQLLIWLRIWVLKFQVGIGFGGFYWVCEKNLVKRLDKFRELRQYC
ncbi:hypothetical protein [Microcoleus vaginatus]|uniref:hypothetical protein n=1 Tax=Microcoleus vaginatus TaxID=119532 RepID=UPI0026917360